MPENNDFGFNVLVGDRLLWEYYADGKIYVESSTQSSNSYKILSENGNEVMVTPYKIALQAGNHAVPRFYVLYVDGTRITKAFMYGGKKRMFCGTLEQSEMKEFVFTFPVEDQTDDQPPSADSFKNLGSIRIDAVEAVDTGIKEYYYQSHFRPVTDENYPLQSCLRTLKHASKKDVMKITKGQYPMLYSGTGHTVQIQERSSISRLRRRFTLGKTISSIELHYRTRLALEVLGIVDLPENQIPLPEGNEEDVLPENQQVDDSESAESIIHETCEEKYLTNQQSPLHDKQDANIIQESALVEDQCLIKKQLICDEGEEANGKEPLVPSFDIVISPNSLDHEVIGKNIVGHPLSFKVNDSDIEIVDVTYDRVTKVKCEQTEENMWKDSSIIWEGDDDCLITMVKKPWDISLIVLTDSDGDD
ncbi:hypothetical protein LSH36_39g10019 [Paralvinella palmiformis]|uniref:Uncharacterized protein n=1 Tax=Paralvinella palmiformis TaxID=53620 RepID=A0AAD9K7U5_9ANNE|nr:hypothetical protein LSH36_39g10019 [Paralvinella palmiformis]